MLKDTRFILVRAECPYVQFAAAARVISTERFVVGVQTVERGTCPKSLMERSKCVESSVAAQQCVMWCVRCEIDPSLSGVPCLPFYRSRGSRSYRREKKEN